MRVRSLIIALVFVAGAGAAHAQDRTLERVHNMIATGRLTEARNTLTAWQRDNSDPRSVATPDDRARALYLTGALSTDAKAAEDAFIGVVLSYPSSPVAPDALLRLGQSFYAAGETDRAITFLQRLRSDYPGSPQRETGMLWLTRAHLASGNAAAACGTARETLFGTTNENVRTLIEIERDRACTQSGGVATTAERTDIIMPQRPPSPVDSPRAAARNARAEQDARDQAAREQARDGRAARAEAEQAARDQAAREQRARSAQPAPAGPPVTPTARPAAPLPDLGIAVDANVREPAPREQPQTRTPADDRTTTPTADTSARTDETAAPPPAPESTPANTAEYGVQTAAFAERRAAETIAGELRARGFDARIVQVPGSPYFRVRYGAFRTSAEAAAAALRIRDAGFATLVVNDVRLERVP